MRETWQRLGTVGAWAALAAATAACGGGGGNKGAPLDGGGHDATGPTFGDGGADTGIGPPTCDAGCPTGTTCDFGVCEPPQPACVTNADCNDDTYCNAAGQCVPYGSAPDHKTNDPSCAQTAAPGVFQPRVLCEFTQPPAGDPFPAHLDVQATPIVVNFNKPGPDGSLGPPSIVAPFTAPVAPAMAGGSNGYTEVLGVLRVLKGTDCTLQANIGGVDINGDGTIDWVNSSSAVAVGDLNGDGVAEIVAYMGDRTTVAFTVDGNGKWSPLWPKMFATLADGVTPFVSSSDGTDYPSIMHGTCVPTTGAFCSNDIWSAPSIHDIDNDGVPEILREGYVIEGNTGILRAPLPADYVSYSVGIPPVLADLDLDGNVELVTGAHVWQFDPVGNAWTDAPGYSQAVSTPPGWTGIADMNPYDGLKKPEIAVASSNKLTIYSLDHSVFMNMDVNVPPSLAMGPGGGGPPTIADYDNDGLPEVGLAGADAYTVFDPDCQATPRPGGKCADRTHCEFAGGPCPDYILWSKQSQDHSSNITGSSVFDFEGDGTPEAIYADECFTRVYSGFDGTVLFSQYHSSCTWIENPVVADVDGDFRAELVVMSNLACGPPPNGIACGQLDANGVDTEFAGTQCKVDGDCASGQCGMGLCRCTTTAQCCALNDDAMCLEAGLSCAPPPMGTPGNGNTCRAPHPHGLQGIRVYKDANDRWVRSRTIWNQHAYAVTNVNENGTVPKTSAWAANWTTPSLNNFRQNVPGTGSGNAVGDLTAQAGQFYTCSGGQAAMAVPVCNRGSAPVGAGIAVGFYVANKLVCSAMTTTPLQPGTCETVDCTWTTPPTTEATETNVTVVANDGGHTAVCYDNNKGLIEDVFCAPPN